MHMLVPGKAKLCVEPYRVEFELTRALAEPSLSLTLSSTGFQARLELGSRLCQARAWGYRLARARLVDSPSPQQVIRIEYVPKTFIGFL
jgi:hypothetical protein